MNASPSRPAATPLSSWAALCGAVLLLSACLLGAGCPAGKDREVVTHDPQVQLKYEMAKRALREIVAARKSGKRIYGDCQAVKLLAEQSLASQKQPQIRSLMRRIKAACADAAPY